jgi:hypothetical protein
MSYDFVGLENLPNVYISKIALRDTSIEVSLLMLDEIYEDFFVWSDDALIGDYLKVVVIATSNLLLRSRLESGNINPLPFSLRRQGILMSNTHIVETSVKQMTMTKDLRSRRYFTKIEANIAENAPDVSLYAFTYLDTSELANSLRIALTGPLRNYYGSITSERVLFNGVPQPTTFIYREANGDIWSGPIHEHDGEPMGGSYHTNAPHPSLTREIAINTKLVNERFEELQFPDGVQLLSNPSFSPLNQSFTNEADFIGLFSIDLRSIVLTKTKYGRKMANVSRDIFETFSKSMMINSFEIRRQQVKFRAGTNKLGTRKYTQKLIGSYRTIDATIENELGFVNTDKISQVFMTTDPLIKSFQFIDEEMSEKTRGEFRYEAIITFIDKSKIFLESLLTQMESNISDLKVAQEFLFRPAQYDRANNILKQGVNVPDIFNSAIDNYYQNLSLVMKLDDETKQDLVNNKKKLFKHGNYTNTSALRFIEDFSKLVTKLTQKFDIQKKGLRLTGARKPSSAITPGLITISYVFEERIKFDDVVASYDFLGSQSNKSLISLTKDEYMKRANKEVNRFFNTKRSTMSTDLADLDTDDMSALKDLDSAKVGFLAPLSFKFKSEVKDLTSLQNLDADGISKNFVNHMIKKQTDPRFSSAAVKKQKNIQPKRTKSKTRRTFQKKRPGRAVFNFNRTPLKINNLKPEKYLDVSIYLGLDSEMVNVEGRTEQPVVAPANNQIDRKVMITQGLSVKREKISYDLQAKNNIFEKFKSSPKFDRKKLKMIPLPIKALLNSRSDAAKNNILESESDILKDPETKIATEMIFQTSQKVEYFAGFSLDANGMPNVSQPNWEEITPIALDNNDRLLCRMRYVEIPEMGIVPAPELKLLAQNSTFFISNGAIEDGISITPESPNIDEEVELPELDDVVFASSNYVKQNLDRKSQIIQSQQLPIDRTPQPTSDPVQGPTGGGASAQISSY